MTPNQETLRIISAWLTSLGEVTRTGSEPITANKIATYASLLGQDHPSAAFNGLSLHHVVQGQEFFPAYDVIRVRVTEWWRENRPSSAVPRLSSQVDAPGLNDMDKRWVAYFNRRKFGPKNPDDGPYDEFQCLSLVRAYSPAAFEHVSGRKVNDWLGADVERFKNGFGKSDGR